MEITVVEPVAGRPSVIGRRSSSRGGRSLMLNGHLDTVGVEGMEAPFEPRVQDGRLHGRGAYDMKGSIAACLAAVKALSDGSVDLTGDLVVAAVADEEVESLGTTAVLDAVRTDGAIVTEPTELAVCLAHKGFAWIEVEVRGRAAHGSRFDEGVDANLRMGRVLHALEALGHELVTRPPHALVGPPSLHASTIAGGTGWSTYAERCVLGIERRTVPGETGASALADIEAILARLREDEPDLDVAARVVLERDPFEADGGGEMATVVTAAAASVLGGSPTRQGVAYWMDAALCGARGIDTVVIGPVGAGAHAADEWVDLESCRRLAEILARTAVEYCGAA
jgi:acetylornithine deacetylase